MNDKGCVICGAMSFKLSKQQRCIQTQMKRALRDQCKWIVPMKHLMFDNFLGDAMKANGCASKRCFPSKKKEKAKEGNCLKSIFDLKH
jgi:hypothetical protein